MQAALSEYRRVARQDERDQLILDHVPFVRHILGRMLGGLPDNVDEDNLEGAALLGLVEAAGQFDPSREIAFTTFAYPRIRGAILDELRRNCPLPQQILQHWSLIREASQTLTPPFTTQTLADTTGLPVADVETCLSAIRLTRPESWEKELHSSASSVAAAHEPGARIDASEERELLAGAIEELPEQQRTAISLYYMEQLRMREIGEVMDLSESRVSRLIAAAELELRSRVWSRLDGET